MVWNPFNSKVLIYLRLTDKASKEGTVMATGLPESRVLHTINTTTGPE